MIHFGDAGKKFFALIILTMPLLMHAQTPASSINPTGTIYAASNAKTGPRYNVSDLSYGAKGDGVTDDTAAIQSAFADCGNTFHNPPKDTQQRSGIVEFEGGHNYLISKTINTYNCQIEGGTGNLQNPNTPSKIVWNGPTAGAISNITGYSISSNTLSFTAENSLNAGQYVEIRGMKKGFYLNRAILQVSPTGLSNTQFEAKLPFNHPDVNQTEDVGTATTVNVILAIAPNARYQQSISNIFITGNNFQVGIYFGGRVDTGTRFANTWVGAATEYNYYFADGGINVDFDKGWRSDGAGVSGIYWRIGGSDSFGIANGTIDNRRGKDNSAESGAALMLDNSACTPNSSIHFTSRNIKIEINQSLSPDLGAIHLYDCPSNASGEQFFLDFENTWIAPATYSMPGFSFTPIEMSPANDKALNLSVLNSQFPRGMGLNTTQRWVGLPELLRHDMLGQSGMIPILSYTPSLNSGGEGATTSRSPIQLMGDVNINQLWQYGVHASDLLYSDNNFAALPNGTTVFSGQILAPPNYWSGVNDKRYAINVIYKTGTTGTPNSGQTTCSGTRQTRVLTCTSAADLSAGQRVTIGADSYLTINDVDATNPNAVLVNLTGNLNATYSGSVLSFSSPMIGPEMQLPTKSIGAPLSLAWSQGDMEQNTGATSNGIAAWVNVAAGSPGSWAGIPLGNSNGQIAPSQISSTTGSGSVVLSSTLPLAATTELIGGSPLHPGCANQPAVTVTGVTTNMACVMSGAGGMQPANIEPRCFVSGTNTVTPQLCTAVATTPAAQSYNIRVIQ